MVCKIVSLAFLRGRSHFLENEVYIGKQYPHLEVSSDKWSSPFYPAVRAGSSPQRAVDLYRRHVLRSPHLRGHNLLELSGKTLVCDCMYSYNHDQQYCHGTVLVELLEEFLNHKKQKSGGVSLSGDRVTIFRGATCPLSNLYIFSLSNCSHTTAYALYCQQKARKFEQPNILKRIKKCDNCVPELTRLCNLADKGASKKALRNWNPIAEMFTILENKAGCCYSFVNACVMSPPTDEPFHLFIEASENDFWSSGLTFVDAKKMLEDNEDLFSVQGRNVQGWMLTMLRLKHAGYFYPDQTAKNFAMNTAFYGKADGVFMPEKILQILHENFYSAFPFRHLVDAWSAFSTGETPKKDAVLMLLELLRPLFVGYSLVFRALLN